MDPVGSELFVVIPVYNEAKGIQGTIERWRKAFISAGVSFTILVIDDGSKDATPPVLDDLAKKYNSIRIIHKANEGHGATILRGYRQALDSGCPWVFQVDSDDQFYPEDFQALWEKRDNFDFLLGYRAHRNDPLSRLIITRILKAWIFLLWGVLIRDANCPYRLIKAPVLARVLDKIPKSVFAPNIFLSIAVRLTPGARSADMPVRHKPRQFGNSSIRSFSLLKKVARSFFELAEYRKVMR